MSHIQVWTPSTRLVSGHVRSSKGDCYNNISVQYNFVMVLPVTRGPGILKVEQAPVLER
jgi:hypothetical protein